MRKVIINLNDKKTPESIQNLIAGLMDFPDYYGHNLDALHDCLTEIGEETCIGIYVPADPGEIAPYLKRLARVFKDSERENDKLAVFFSNLYL